MCDDLATCPRSRALTQPLQAADFFTQMTARLARHGGLISEAALQARLHRQGHPFTDVSAWLAQGRLRAIAWRSQRWLPAFQLGEDGRSLRGDVEAVADELAGAMDDLEILAWFTCPNEALGSETPIQRLSTGLPDVMEAARLDRFLAST